MIYRELGRTGIKLSRLGFGAMRLPMTESGGKNIVDYDKAVPAMQRAFELGVNYIDTAPYYCESDSETAVGKALKGWRDKVCLSTKNPIEDSSGDNWRRRLETSLKKLDVDCIDFYYMWSLSLESFREKVDVKGGPITAARKALDEGLIKHLSFSFHDKSEHMKPIIDSGYFESVLCQYNMLDRSNEEMIAYAREKGLGVIVMGPVGGGRLGAPSQVICGMLGREAASTAELALRFVLSNPNVDMALSGMQNLDMVEENVKTASIDGLLTPDELKKVEAMMQENKKLAELYCTGCKYCMPCPQGINIPYVFELMNYHKVYGLTDFSKAEYAKLSVRVADRANEWLQAQGESPVHCVECGECEVKCPQKLKVVEQLKETAETLA